MIVILSYAGDTVSSAVGDWLHRYNCNYRCINLEEEDFRKLTFSIATHELVIELGLSTGELLKLKEVSFFFFRGGLLKLDLHNYKKHRRKDYKDLPDALVETHVLHEFKTIVSFFYKQIAKKCLGNPMLQPLNKLEQLEIAQHVGLKIPVTIVNSTKKHLMESRIKDNLVFITKSIQENVLYQQSAKIHYDLKVNELDETAVSDFYFPSLFQESIQKLMEIRVFYLDGAFYSIAMLLCASKQMVVDYRRATSQIRYAKYTLPAEVQIKLKQLMKRLGLNTGSIDLMLTVKGDYYFLEVNPTGQIGWVSDYGNYCLEEKIAQYLIKKETAFIHENTTSPAS